MSSVIIWALLTGGITGGVWASIVLLGRQRRMARLQSGMKKELERRLDDLENVNTRLEDLAQRLDFTERLLAQEREAARIRPPEKE